MVDDIKLLQVQKRILNVVGIYSSLNTMHKQIKNTKIESIYKKNDSYQRYLNKKKLLLCKTPLIELPVQGNKTQSFSLGCNCKCTIL